MFTLAYDGALRRNELVTLRLDDFDFPAQQVTIRAEHAKSGYPRTVVYSEPTGTSASPLSAGTPQARPRDALFVPFRKPKKSIEATRRFHVGTVGRGPGARRECAWLQHPHAAPPSADRSSPSRPRYYRDSEVRRPSQYGKHHDVYSSERPRPGACLRSRLTDHGGKAWPAMTGVPTGPRRSDPAITDSERDMLLRAQVPVAGMRDHALMADVAPLLGPVRQILETYGYRWPSIQTRVIHAIIDGTLDLGTMPQSWGIEEWDDVRGRFAGAAKLPFTVCAVRGYDVPCGKEPTYSIMLAIGLLWRGVSTDARRSIREMPAHTRRVGKDRIQL